MVKMNDIMNVMLKDEKEVESSLQLDSILTEIVSKTKKIKNCIIYDKDGTLEEENINFDRILQFVGDWTGYEVSCNEVRVDKNIISYGQFVGFASRLEGRLSEKFNDRKIVVYISVYENEIELRFHTYRKNERLWLDNDLNKYDTPILCWMQKIDNI